jgi:hypothetical protein
VTEGQPTPGAPQNPDTAETPAVMAATPAPELVPEPPVPTLPPSPAPDLGGGTASSPVSALAERPEVLVGAAFAGGLVLAFVLRRITSS